MLLLPIRGRWDRMLVVLRNIVIMILFAVVLFPIVGCRLFSTHTETNVSIIKDSRIEEIRYKGWWWRTLDPAPGTFVMIDKTLYVNKENWEALQIGSIETEALLAHEETHLIRQQQEGVLWWALQYVFDMEFRWNEEKLAHMAEWEYLMRFHNRKFNEGSYRVYEYRVQHTSYLSVEKGKAQAFMRTMIPFLRMQLMVEKWLGSTGKCYLFFRIEK